MALNVLRYKLMINNPSSCLKCGANSEILYKLVYKNNATYKKASV